jgi:hypothetical protein
MVLTRGHDDGQGGLGRLQMRSSSSSRVAALALHLHPGGWAARGAAGAFHDRRLRRLPRAVGLPSGTETARTLCSDSLVLCTIICHMLCSAQPC